jgi:RHS repeat-associated protein
VTPDNGSAGPYQSNTSGHTVTFTVKSTVAGGKWYFYCWDGGGVTCTGLSKSVATLSLNQSTTVTATYSVGTSDGDVWLEARPPAGDAGGDFGNYDVDVVTPPPPRGPPTVTMLEGIGDRSRCLSIAVTGYADDQCGDLVVGHGMPSFRTVGRDRALTLVYSSQQATANMLVPVKVALGSPYGAPDSVIARLRVNTSGTFVVRDSGHYKSWGDPAGVLPPEARQIVLRFDASAISTGAYPFQVEVQGQYLNDQGHVYADTLSGTLLVVNQSASAFGRGWNVAGVERLYLNQPAGQNGILRVGGDGSAALYQSAGANTWAAPAAAYRDTITWDGSTYTRKLKHGIRVVYDNLGRQINTINAVGQETVFKWNATVTSQLDSIRVPPAGQPYVTYRLYYTGGKLDYIADPVGRHLNATVTNGNLVSLQDPDLVSTLFGYDGSGRMISRTSRQGTIDTYAYDAAGRLAQARLRRDSLHTDTTRYMAWDALGIRATGGVSQAARWDTVRTTMNGPRTDVADITRFRIGAFGAPDTIINALGQRTAIERTDGRFPALVTKVTYPTLWTVRQVYDSRGNLTALVDSTGEVGRPVRTTTWLYTDSYNPDAPTKVSDGKGRTTTYHYNSFGQPYLVTDPRGHNTNIGYTSAPSPLGLVASISEAQVETWREIASASDTSDVRLNQTTSFTYDARGNLKTITAPDGLVSAAVADSIGRVLRSYTPTGMETERVYDKLNRITQFRQITSRQALPYGLSLATMNCDTTQVLCADSSRGYDPTLTYLLTTSYYYGLAGLDSLLDPRAVAQRFRYNANGQIRETRDEQNAATIAYLNALGTADSVRLRTGKVIKFQYDVLGRLTSRTMPGHPYTAPGTGCDANCQAQFAATGDSEVVSYSYDAGGNLTKAHGNNGEIRRSYFRDGSLKGQYNTTAGLNDSLSVAYDSAGARTVLRHYGPSRVDSVQYVYDAGGAVSQYKLYWPGTGVPSRVITVERDALGRRRKITYPGGLTAWYSYDMAGNLRRLKSKFPTNGAGTFTLRNKAYDATGHLLEQEIVCGTTAAGAPCEGLSARTMSARYNHLGALVWQHFAGRGLDSLGYDASGNLVFKATREAYHFGSPEVRRFTYLGRSNRIFSEKLDAVGGGSPVVYSYEPDGSRKLELPTPQDNSFRERWYYYDALGRTTGLGSYVPWRYEPHVCLYDADGQMYKPCQIDAPTLGFDGASVITALGNARWHFVQGDGLDDPLSAVGTWSNDTPKELFFVTDGAGQVLATVDSAGVLPAVVDSTVGWQGWSYHGAATRTQGFTANRLSNATAPEYGYYRNRLYDQSTGRWTQEDPLGVAGGINLYQFNGNNPVTFTDPFGLKCTEAQAKKLKNRIQNGARELKQRIKEYEEEPFDKVRPDGRAYDHPAKIKEMQDGLARRRAEYLKKCDNDDDDDFRNGLSSMDELLAYHPGPQLKLLEVSPAAADGSRMSSAVSAKVGAAMLGGVIGAWIVDNLWAFAFAPAL